MPIYLENVDKGPCDKCHVDVEPENNALYWAIVFDALKKELDTEQALDNFVSNPTSGLYLVRHLLPTGDCEGSPSRASKLESMTSYDTEQQRKLPREEWIPMDPREASLAREAYDIIQEIRTPWL